jgi:hypothetical protein
MSYPGVVAPTPASTCRQSLQDLMFCAIQSITDLNAGAARRRRRSTRGHFLKAATASRITRR